MKNGDAVFNPKDLIDMRDYSDSDDDPILKQFRKGKRKSTGVGRNYIPKLQTVDNKYNPKSESVHQRQASGEYGLPRTDRNAKMATLEYGQQAMNMYSPMQHHSPKRVNGHHPAQS